MIAGASAGPSLARILSSGAAVVGSGISTSGKAALKARISRERCAAIRSILAIERRRALVAFSPFGFGRTLVSTTSP